MLRPCPYAPLGGHVGMGEERRRPRAANPSGNREPESVGMGRPSPVPVDISDGHRVPEIRSHLQEYEVYLIPAPRPAPSLNTALHAPRNILGFQFPASATPHRDRFPPALQSAGAASGGTSPKFPPARTTSGAHHVCSHSRGEKAGGGGLGACEGKGWGGGLWDARWRERGHSPLPGSNSRWGRLRRTLGRVRPQVMRSFDLPTSRPPFCSPGEISVRGCGVLLPGLGSPTFAPKWISCL